MTKGNKVYHFQIREHRKDWSGMERNQVIVIKKRKTVKIPLTKTYVEE